jgi:anti-sigma factor RsiW
MSKMPGDDEQTDADADRQAAAMKDQLRKDVAMWSSARADGSSRQSADLSEAVAKQPPASTARRVKRTQPASPATSPLGGPKKPFSMSYDGVPQADYITYMIARGAK